MTEREFLTAEAMTDMTKRYKELSDEAETKAWAHDAIALLCLVSDETWADDARWAVENYDDQAPLPVLEVWARDAAEVLGGLSFEFTMTRHKNKSAQERG